MSLIWDACNRMKSEQRSMFEGKPTDLRAFIRAWHRLHVFPRLTPTVCFPALDTGCMFSRAWHRMHVFPRLAPDDVFPRLAPIACFFTLIILLHLGLVSDAVCFAFSFITSVKTEPFLQLNYKHNVLEKLYCLTFYSYWLVPRYCYSFHLDLHQEKVGMILVSRFYL